MIHVTVIFQKHQLENTLHNCNKTNSRSCQIKIKEINFDESVKTFVGRTENNPIDKSNKTRRFQVTVLRFMIIFWQIVYCQITFFYVHVSYNILVQVEGLHISSNSHLTVLKIYHRKQTLVQ